MNRCCIGRFKHMTQCFRHKIMILFYEITFSGDNNVFDKDIISKVMSFIEIKQFFIFAKY